MISLIDDLEKVVQQVKSWPAETRIALARRVLETLEISQEVATEGLRGPSTRQVIGLWNPAGGTAPTDQECEEILAEELIRKHSS